jgi:hypothetical protein
VHHPTTPPVLQGPIRLTGIPVSVGPGKPGTITSS